MRISGVDEKQIREALLSAFTKVVQIEQLLRDVDLEPREIIASKMTPSEAIHAALEAVQANDCVDAFIAEAKQINPGNQLLKALPESFPDVSVSATAQKLPPNPYRGLLAFREQDADFFFGRDLLITKLLDRVPRQPLTVLVGASGSGKSSVVFAGLLPALRRASNWCIVTMRPGTNPFHELAAALVDQLEPTLTETDRLIATAKLNGALRDNSLSLADVLRRIIARQSDGTRLLLVIDQFEELYTLSTQDVRTRFLELVTAALATGPWTLLWTLRADFTGNVLGDRPLADLLEQHLVTIGPMSRAELQQAIEAPAAAQGVSFEADLVTRILDDLGNEPGILPLLAFALELLWDRQMRDVITHRAYSSIGSVRQALAQRADRLFAGLSEPQQAVARELFLQLTELGEGAEDTRRIANRADLARRIDSSQFAPVLETLVKARLVTASGDQDAEDARKSIQIEVAHEALIRAWPRLREWVAEDRERLRFERQIVRDAAIWNAQLERDASGLYVGARLARALELRDSEQIKLDAPAPEFLRVSQEAAGRARRQGVAVVTAAFSALVVLLLIMGSLAWYANMRRIEVERSATRIQAQSFAIAGRDALDNQLPLALLLGIESQRIDASAAAFAVIDQSASTLAPPLATLTHEGWVYGAAWNGDGSRILTYSQDGTAKVWEAATGEPLATLTHAGRVTGAAWNEDESRILTYSFDGPAKVWEATSGALLATLSQGDDVNGAAWNGDDSRILTYGWERTARVWDAATGEPLATLTHEDRVNGAAWNGDDSRILTYSNDGTARVWDAATGEPLATLMHGNTVTGAAWNGDESRILTYSDDGTARVWDANSGRLLTDTSLLGISVRWAEWIPNYSQIILLAPDGNVYRYWANDSALLAAACERVPRNLMWDEWQRYFPLEPTYRKTCDNLPIHPSVPNEAR